MYSCPYIPLLTWNELQRLHRLINKILPIYHGCSFCKLLEDSNQYPEYSTTCVSMYRNFCFILFLHITLSLYYIYIYISLCFILSLKWAPETPQTLEYSFAYLPSLPYPWSASRRFHEFQWHSASCACMLLHIYIHSCPYISFSPWS